MKKNRLEEISSKDNSSNFKPNIISQRNSITTVGLFKPIRTNSEYKHLINNVNPPSSSTPIPMSPSLNGNETNLSRPVSIMSIDEESNRKSPIEWLEIIDKRKDLGQELLKYYAELNTQYQTQETYIMLAATLMNYELHMSGKHNLKPFFNYYQTAISMEKGFLLQRKMIDICKEIKNLHQEEHQTDQMDCMIDNDAKLTQEFLDAEKQLQCYEKIENHHSLMMDNLQKMFTLINDPSKEPEILELYEEMNRLYQDKIDLQEEVLSIADPKHREAMREVELKHQQEVRRYEKVYDENIRKAAVQLHNYDPPTAIKLN